MRPSKASTKIANGALVLQQSRWAVYNRRVNVWWSKLKKWIGGAYNRRVKQMEKEKKLCRQAQEQEQEQCRQAQEVGRRYKQAQA